jgi:hypothetical protein
MTKPHVIILTEGEIKALANLCRVAMKMGGEIPYVQSLRVNGGDSGFGKLMKKIEEINNDSNGK